MRKVYHTPSVTAIEFESQHLLTVLSPVGHQNPTFGGNLGDDEEDPQTAPD